MLRKLLNLLSDSVLYGLSNSLSRLVGMVLAIFLTDYLSVEDYGVYYMLNIVALVFVPVATLGVTNAIFRYFNTNKDLAARATVLSTGLASVVVSTLVCLVLGLFFAPQIAAFVISDPASAPLVRLTLLGAACTTVGGIFAAVLRAGRRVKTTATVNVARAILTVVLSLWLVIGMAMGLRGLVLGGVLVEVTSMIVQLGIAAGAFSISFDWAVWRRLMNYGLPMAPHLLQATLLDLFGAFMVTHLIGLEANGLYGMAARFAAPISLVVSSIQTSWVPYKFEIHAKDEDPKGFFKMAVIYYAAGLAYLWLGASLWGPDVLRLLTTPPFHPAALLIWATSLVPVSLGVYFMCGTGIELGDNTRAIPLVSFAGLVTVVIAAYFLIGPLGALGAALATVAARLVMACIVYLLSQKYFPIGYDVGTLLTLAALAAVGVTIGYAMQFQPLVPRLLVNVLLTLVYPAAAVFVLMRSRDERGRVRKLLVKLKMAS